MRYVMEIALCNQSNKQKGKIMENRTIGSLVGAGTGSVGAAGTVVALGGGTSAAAITSGLAAAGLGFGMLGGIGILGLGVYGVSKITEEIFSWFDD